MNPIGDVLILDSFWTIWFWIAHAVAWSLLSHFALGVPFDMVVQANREDDETGPWSRATEAMIHAQVFRFSYLGRRYGVAMTAVSAFLLSALATLGWYSNIEIARAAMSIFAPMTMIYVVSVRTAIRLETQELTGRPLRDAIRRQRLWNQLIGIFAIMTAVIWAVIHYLGTVRPFWL